MAVGDEDQTVPVIEHWKLESPPDTPAEVAVDLVELRQPLVSVARHDEGTWCFDGPGAAREDTERMTLADVLHAWPHVAVLRDVPPGQVAIWDWDDNGWRIGPLPDQEEAVELGTDLDDSLWPEGVAADGVAVVERAVVTGEELLTDVQRDQEGFFFVGPGDDELEPDAYVRVRLCDAVRRWPHSFGVVRALEPGEGVEWNADEQQWEGYLLLGSAEPPEPEA
jgi:hypothetical protein